MVLNPGGDFEPGMEVPNIGALIVRIGFWDPFYYNYNKEAPKIVLGII